MFPNPSRAADARKIYPRLSATCASESDEATSCILIPTLVSHAHITSVDLVARRRSNGAFDSKDLSLLPPLYHKSLAHGIPSPMFPFSSLFYVTSPLRHSFIKRRRLRLTEDQVCQDTNLSRIGPSWIFKIRWSTSDGMDTAAGASWPEASWGSWTASGASRRPSTHRPLGVSSVWAGRDMYVFITVGFSVPLSSTQ